MFFLALIFVYDFHPGAETLKQRHFSGLRPDGFADEARPNRGGRTSKFTGVHGLLPEALIWYVFLRKK